jgi:AcrR family transcriptional regulator
MNDSATTRDRIIAAAAAILDTEGRDAVSTRSVSAAAGVQPPAIYRLFGDMQGLLDAVAHFGFSEYLAQKTSAAPEPDPVDGLRRGWDLHIGFGLSHPALYALMYGQPGTGVASDAAAEAMAILRSLVERVARSGRLAVDVDTAVGMIHAAGCGVTLSLIAASADRRDQALAGRTREAILAAVTAGADAGTDADADAETDAGRAAAEPRGPGRHVPDDGNAAGRHAIALKATLAAGGSTAAGLLTAGESVLLGEWLDRLSRA